VLVDADTGAVLAGSNARMPMRVASVSKILTAIVVRENLPAGTEVTVSPRAEGMPARKMNLKAGQVWKSDDLMHALLIVSANDAAVALAEQTAGSLEAFGGMLDRTASRLGIADSPVLRDPAGLDDEFSVDGGNLISARDVAIVSREFLTYPELAGIVSAPIYRFSGGDGNPHRLLNHDPLLKTYAGAIGIKTGYTRRSGHSLAAAARRGGRTMIAVVIGAADAPRSAAGLLDQGFAIPVAGEARTDVLPSVSRGDARDTATKALPAPRPVSTPSAAASVRARHRSGISVSLLLLLVGGLPAVVILLRRSAALSGGHSHRIPTTMSSRPRI
jgi:D-alanyl-D-alanine carboxypeptidase (penicillin-binding protein 5/6)